MSNVPATVSNFLQKTTANFRPQTSAMVDGAFLRFSGKSGEWSLGKDEIDVENEVCVLNLLDAKHGWVRWGEALPVRKYVSIADPYPDEIPVFEGSENGRPRTYASQPARQISGRFIDDELGNFVFETNSMGGVENLDVLLTQAILRANEGAYYCPKVVLSSEWYKRADGKVYKPVFEIEGWCDIEGNMEGATPKLAAAPQAEPEPEPEPEPAPTRRRRRK